MSAEIRTLAIPSGSLPAPLVPPEVDVASAEGCMLSLRDLRDSDWMRQLDLAERGVALALHLEAMRGFPSGSLPDNDVLLASYVGLSVREVGIFQKMKERVMHGWVRCADGRWHHRDRARNVLEIWIGRLEDRRGKAFGNQSQLPDREFGIPAIEADILVATAALRLIDPQTQFLRKLDSRLARWGKKPKAPARDEDLAVAVPVTQEIEGVTAPVTPGNLPVAAPLSEAKRSEINSSSERSSEDSRISQHHQLESEEEERSLDRTATRSDDVKRSIPPWPPDWLGQFKTRYPRKRSWGDAEKALAAVRKSGKVSFDAILAGIDHLIAEGRAPEFLPYPATWVRDRGWEDEPEPPGGPRGTPPPNGRAPRRNTAFQATETFLKEYRNGQSPVSRDPFGR